MGKHVTVLENEAFSILGKMRDGHACLVDAAREFDALVPTVVDNVPAPVFESGGRRIRLVANYGVGYDRIDIDAARREGVVVTNTPGVLTEDTADLALLLLLAAARRLGVPVVVVHSGDVFELGKLELRILWPDDPGLPSEDPNQHAVVALASYGKTDVLLTADAESDVTSRLHLRPVEVLKVAHHGSEDPGLPDLLGVLRPRVAVISVGAHNDYDHPRPETLAALAAQPGLRTLRTDVNGRIVVESDGRTLTVRSER